MADADVTDADVTDADVTDADVTDHELINAWQRLRAGMATCDTHLGRALHSTDDDIVKVWEALATLAQAPERTCTTGGLGRALGLDASDVDGVIQRLIDAGYVDIRHLDGKHCPIMTAMATGAAVTLTDLGARREQDTTSSYASRLRRELGAPGLRQLSQLAAIWDGLARAVIAQCDDNDQSGLVR